jgi:hypothetical protein
LGISSREDDVIPSTELLGRITQLDEWQQEMLQHIQTDLSPLQLIEWLKNNVAVFAGDGSVHFNVASFGWVLSNKTGERIDGAQIASVPKDTPSYPSFYFSI